MPTRVIPAEQWPEALQPLRAGQVVAIPTDTVYGVAAMPEDPAAIEAVYVAKDRPAEKALPMLVAGPEDAERIARLDADLLRLCRAFWPGALTVVAPAAPGFSSVAISDEGTVAVRMPALGLALCVIRASGGVLAVTSANRSGQPPATSALEVLEQLDGRIAAVLDGGASPGGVASTVIRVRDGRPEILREGAIPTGDLLRVLSS